MRHVSFLDEVEVTDWSPYGPIGWGLRKASSEYQKKGDKRPSSRVTELGTLAATEAARYAVASHAAATFAQCFYDFQFLDDDQEKREISLNFTSGHRVLR